MTTGDSPETESGPPPVYDYSAFISYSRKDGAFAQWLHRRLEAFRFPSYDGRTLTKNRRNPLSPAFRDLDELAASGDLGQSIRSALDKSNALVILCSRAAAASPWVNREIEYFLSLGRHDRILQILLDGEPVLAEPGGNPDAAFPLALKDDPSENLWIDARGVESRERTFARIAAGLLGVSFDQVWKRKQRADRNRAIMTTAAAILIGVPLVVFGWTAAQPVRMADCPIDKLTFAPGWTRDLGEKFVVARVGRTEFAWCGDKQVDWTPKLEEDINCRGPYGETVFEGEYTDAETDPATGKNRTTRDIYPAYSTDSSLPCCWWNVRDKDTIKPVLADRRFKWWKPGEAPLLADMQFNEIAASDSTQDDPGLLTGNKVLTAAECRVDLPGRLGMAVDEIEKWFGPHELTPEEFEKQLDKADKMKTPT